jgi:hypothetical protein
MHMVLSLLAKNMRMFSFSEKVKRDFIIIRGDINFVLSRREVLGGIATWNLFLLISGAS